MEDTLEGLRRSSLMGNDLQSRTWECAWEAVAGEYIRANMLADIS
jgi:hypothetical protein